MSNPFFVTASDDEGARRDALANKQDILKPVTPTSEGGEG